MKRHIATIIILICVSISMMEARGFTLVIDAGHGGHDAGAVGKHSKEKDINLRTALAFGRYVERNCPDVTVIYTRKKDMFVTLHGRAEIANKAKADLFVSIHTNALPKNHSARGLETYTLGMDRAEENLEVAKRENSVILKEDNYKERYQGFDPNSAESYIIFDLMQDNNMQRSVDMAQLVQKNVCSTASRPDKGVKQAGFLVLRETSMPSCLIELGFISTPAEEQMLNNDAAIDNMAKGIYKAFVEYRGKHGSGQTADRQEPKPREEPRAEAKADVQESVDRLADTQKKQEEPTEDGTRPIFKVQIFTADKVLKTSDTRFKGTEGAEYYKEGAMLKYTMGSSEDYNEIYRLRKQLAGKFPDCFIIAFRNGEKMNVNEAIREFKSNKK